PWGQLGDEQSSIKLGQAPRVFLETRGQDRPGGEILDEGDRAADDEILPLGRVVRKGQPSQLAKRSQIVLQSLDVAEDPRRRPAVRLPIREPVQKEHDVARLLLHDPVKDVEQRRRHDQVLATELEQAEGTERVEALLESE